MKRRRPAMRAHHVSVAIVAFIAFCAGGASSSATEQPNVLFIAVDDMNDYISPLDHHPGVKTPNLDRLAARSVTFANAHCAAPACHPSRVSVMTGVHPSRSGLYTNLFRAHGPRWRRESAVLADAIVLSQHFRDHGYYAVGGGKIFHTLQWTPGDSQNDPDAWDEYFHDALNPLPTWVRPNLIDDQEAGLSAGRPLGGEASRQLFGAAALDVPDEATSDHQIVDWAIGEMNRPRSKPLFLAVGLFRPHIPWEVPRKYFDLHPLDQVQLPEHRRDDLADAFAHDRRDWHRWVVANDLWRKFMQGYLASISYADAQIGRLLDALDASPMAGKTIVVLWSDHGFHIGEKENWEKFALWDQTTRVPLFIHAPGISRDGAKCGQPASLIDVYPTLCELAQLPTPAQCDGQSLVPQLRDPMAERSRPAVVSHVFGGSGAGQAAAASHAVRDERYRYIRYHDGFEELYDLDSDPHEFTNRARDETLAAVKDRLASLVPRSAALPVGIPPEPAPAASTPTKAKRKAAAPNAH